VTENNNNEKIYLPNENTADELVVPLPNGGADVTPPPNDGTGIPNVGSVEVLSAAAPKENVKELGLKVLLSEVDLVPPNTFPDPNREGVVKAGV
jgi:hypothetical protein